MLLSTGLTAKGMKVVVLRFTYLRIMIIIVFIIIVVILVSIEMSIEH